MYHSKKFATFIATCAFSLAGCSPAPSSTVKDFYMSISNGDIKKAMEHVDKKALARKGVSEGKMEAGIAAHSKKYNASDCGGLKEVNIISEDKRGDVSKVTIELVCNTGKKMNEKDSVVKSDGKWLITVSG